MYKFRKPKRLQELKKIDPIPSDKKSEILTADGESNGEKIKELFQNCSDFVAKQVDISDQCTIRLFYFDGLVDIKTLDEFILKPLVLKEFPVGGHEHESISRHIEQELLSITQVKTASNMEDLVTGILQAQVGIIVDGEKNALLADLKGFEKRSIEAPTTEMTIRGPKDSFTESIRTNTTLVRRRICSTKLKLEAFTVGEYTKTSVEMAYIEGIAPESLLKEIRERISRIRMDAALGSEFIEEFIEDAPLSPFPQIQNTERPDIIAGNLMEGKVAIFVDNTPFTLIVPTTFWSGLQAVEDYYERPIYTTFIRWVRYILFNIALFLPSLYVALTTFHPKLIPTPLLISIASAREGVPFPAAIEALIMEFVFEGLREAGIRLPQAVGSAVSIVGALVIGQAAVQAGIVSAPMVIVVATTGIASFAVPRYSLGTAFRMIRFIMLLLAGILGLYGIVLGFIALIIHLVNLRSFGVPYFSPIAPQIPQGFKDVLIRAPRWSFYRRPSLTAGENDKRIPKGQMPSPSQGKNDNEN
jgi:hypothetical protein